MKVELHNEHHLLNLEIYLWIIPFIIIIFYVYAVQQSDKKYRKWPIYRTFLFTSGVVSIVLAIIGPIAEWSHHYFIFHMYSHLLLGMLGPLFIVLSAPITLLLRTLSVQHARKVSHLLKSKYIQTVSHPITASVLNLGGLWILYTTSLFEAMHHSTLLATLVHTHIFLAGYVFTIAIISIDPTPHRTSIKMRSVVLVLYMAGHSVLSKWIYANPPSGVSQLEAENGGMIMYYGGDFIDAIIIIILCYQLFKSSSPQKAPNPSKLHIN